MKICGKNQDELSQHEKLHEKVSSSPRLQLPLFPAPAHQHRQCPNRNIAEGTFAPAWFQSMLSNSNEESNII